MKNILFFFLLIFGCFGFACQSNVTSQKAELVLENTKLDFGIITPEMDTIWRELIVKNEGNTPLLIQDINASCGCTIPVWEEESIPAGQQQKIKVALIRELLGTPKNNSAVDFQKAIVIRSNTSSIFTAVDIVGVLEFSHPMSELIEQ